MFIIKRQTKYEGFILYQTESFTDACDLKDIILTVHPEETVQIFDKNHNEIKV